MYQEYLYKEHKRTYGFRNRDKVFYVICPSASSQGLFSIHNYVLWKVRYAIDHGYIPVVDYQNYANMYLEPQLVGKVNAWEYYFKQPTQYGLKAGMLLYVTNMCPLGIVGLTMKKKYYILIT